MDVQLYIIGVAFFLVALLYASVGHAGATGYLAVMALAGIQPALMKPTALMLNIVVASIASYKYYQKGVISLRLLIPLIVLSIPCAYLGGRINLPPNYYKPLVGLFLLYAAYRAFPTAKQSTDYSIRTAQWPLLCIVGAVLGFLSGLTGVGGGVFLSPLMLVLRWAPIRTISGTAAGFILVNSISGLLGLLSSTPQTLDGMGWWILAVVVGGYLGAEFGSHRFSPPTIQKLLAGTVLIAGIKLLSSVF
jgi:uncharacterized membrane protein YfcA